MMPDCTLSNFALLASADEAGGLLLLGLLVCGIGFALGIMTATPKVVRVPAAVLSPLLGWVVLLLIGAIVSLITGSIPRGIGGVLMISLGYFIIYPVPVVLSCFAGQWCRWRRDAGRAGESRSASCRPPS